MRNEQIIKGLEIIKLMLSDDCQKHYVDMAINSLKAWDKVREQLIDEKYFAYADFERYKVEFLRQDWEDAYISLPQDDYRFGMARAIEIINEHLKGWEE